MQILEKNLLKNNETSIFEALKLTVKVIALGQKVNLLLHSREKVAREIETRIIGVVEGSCKLVGPIETV